MSLASMVLAVVGLVCLIVTAVVNFVAGGMPYASLLPAVFGIFGVVVGAAMTFARDLWFKSKQDTKEREYLAVRVTSLLERYVAGCVEVVMDDGLHRGEPDEDGVYQAQAEEPKFEPESLPVEWKSLDPGLMYEVLVDFPSRIEHAKACIDNEGEHSFPPEYEEWFEERQYQYADLGRRAVALSVKLRTQAGLPQRPAPAADWNPHQVMANRRDEIDALRAKRAAMPSPFDVTPVDLAPRTD
ncbi:hypothetical protein [Burkholderia oklahomensis]|uniref:Uncharacterized protein n=1 Tax=Burkholderia oklahomensis TaxID=342113 RepID=A0AAI8BBT9_9BURK|nr:hypothetical protein [Burkholderia oklahomensis]AIO69278.1 hypothetical protein DM82_4388 [Burkholderia oklahomensis]AOI40075.1 hypothetical protein WG70_10955 [Burkholderia oklahomensis EO147]KUY68366.1 hypothetical protein WG70_25200 [Burkholderia oklahomensis EO147]QPS39556.1 hypothetical protein I6G57_27350 [Burkholderia oklahomensis]